MKTRKDSYFGLHFDFHASPYPGRPPVGDTLTEEEIREICTLLRPDFLQIDCKGHPGWTSYPSSCGNAMPEFSEKAPVNGDPLALWRRVTKEEDVALYMHYSGVIDNRYCKEHPDQAVLGADGKRSGADGGMGSTRTIGSYADDLLIPQLTELAVKYGVNGAWVDGDCWGSHADFDPETIAAFEKETGIDLGGELPSSPDKPYYDEYREFCRELFRRYVRKYVDALHKAKPDFQIASNWSYTDHMPEPVTSDVDFISGDLNPGNSFNSARYAGRAIAQQNHTWDLMAWNFRSANGFYAPKHPVQIMQEAAAVISLGGGFQNYITQQPDGSPRMEQIRRMKPLSDFMRARQDFCFRGHAKHQVGVLMSTYDRHKESGSLYSRNGCEKIMGLTVLLCDAGHSVEIVSEHTIKGKCADYPVLVVPELHAGLAPETIEELLDYAKHGGSLVLVGRKTTRIFADAAGYTVGEVYDPMKAMTVDGIDYGSVYRSRTVPGEAVAWMAGSVKDEPEALAAVQAYGDGFLAFVGADFGSAYQANAQYLHKIIMNRLLDKLYTPSVRIEACEGTLEITDFIKDGRQLIQLVNANGAHRDAGVATEDRIQPCRDITLSIAAEEEPKALILQPAGKKLPFTYADGRITVQVDRVEIHEIIEVVR
ncbi:MAG: hypothetical protein MJ175_05360 [Clostridia bacterium]|nr:hypothetical protein [Clostridia bacterium]